jgi:Fe2+ transport system protein FeoA
MTTLRDMAPGSDAHVHSFSDELQPEVSRRLRELGFGQGDRVRCLRAAPLGGPRVYAVSGAAFALEAELAEQVLVSLVETHDDG